MKKIIQIIFCLFVLSASAQQTPEYSQYILNNYGLDPAAAGNSLKPEILFGRRVQWAGYGGPVSQFISFNKAFAKESFRRYWHGAGIYIEQDQAALITAKQFSGTYSFHYQMIKGYTLAAGLSAGMRTQSFGSSLSNKNDPALSLYPPIVHVYPDISAGVRFYSKKFFVDVSAKQLYKNKIEQGSKMIGTPSYLRPHLYITLGEHFYSEDYYYVFEPSIHIQSTLTEFPSVSGGAMLYINKRAAFGLFGRWPDCIYGVIQLRIYKNIIIGYAYEYTLSRLMSKDANSNEFMIGVSPMLTPEGLPAKFNTSGCPVFDF
jgi:type IX secretion system PorP/SprF family membrane protein